MIFFVSRMACQTKLALSLSTTTQKNHKKGGQSQARIGRLRDNKVAHNIAYVAENLIDVFFDFEQNKPTVSRAHRSTRFDSSFARTTHRCPASLLVALLKCLNKLLVKIC